MKIGLKDKELQLNEDVLNINNITSSKNEAIIKNKKPYDEMNSIIAHLLSSLTCSMRFEGTLDVDINDITMNLVPFPRQHFIMSSLSPLYHVLDQKLEPRRTEQIFDDEKIISSMSRMLHFFCSPSPTGSPADCPKGQRLLHDKV